MRNIGRIGIATWTLLVSGTGILLLYPYRDLFLGGLLLSGMQAAFVGGCADWFGVTALFRNPMGIRWPFPTAVIPRRKDQLVEMVADTVENELLAPANVKVVLDEYALGDRMANFFDSRAGRVLLRYLVISFCLDLLARVNVAKVAGLIPKMAGQGGADLQWRELGEEWIEWSVEKGHGEILFQEILEEGERLIYGNQAEAMLRQFCREVLRRYEGDWASRQITAFFLQQTGIMTPERMTEYVQGKIAGYLQAVRKADSVKGMEFRCQVADWMKAWLGKEDNVTQLIQWQKEWLEQPELILMIQRRLEEGKQRLLQEDRGQGVWGWLGRKVEQQIDKLCDREDWRKKLDGMLKVWLTEWLERHHQEIGGMVREHLNSFSGEGMARLVEEKTGRDLQMIRINGSLVGGIAGMLLYLMGKAACL